MTVNVVAVVGVVVVIVLVISVVGRRRLRRRLCRRVIFSRSSPSSSWSWSSSSTCWIFVVGGFLSPRRGPSVGPLPDPLLGGPPKTSRFSLRTSNETAPFGSDRVRAPFWGPRGPSSQMGLVAITLFSFNPETHKNPMNLMTFYFLTFFR